MKHIIISLILGFCIACGGAQTTEDKPLTDEDINNFYITYCVQFMQEFTCDGTCQRLSRDSFTCEIKAPTWEAHMVCTAQDGGTYCEDTVINYDSID